MSIPPQANYYTPRYIGVAPQTPKPTPQEEGVNPPDAFGTTQGTTSNITPQNTTTKPKGNNPWLWAGILIPTAVIVVVATTLGITASQFQKGLRITPNTPDAKAIQEIPELLESIFGKKFSPEEAELAVKNYQSLLQIKDKDEFITKAFHQVKKDFGYENVPIKLKIETSPIDEYKITGAGSMGKDTLTVYRELDHKRILDIIAHEFTHVCQHEFMSLGGFIPEVYEEKAFQALSRLDRNNPEDLKTVKEFAEELREFYHTLFSPLNRPPIQAGTPEYQRAKKYADSAKNFINNNDAKYDASFVEQEAKTAGKKMGRFIEIIQGNFKTNGAS